MAALVFQPGSAGAGGTSGNTGRFAGREFRGRCRSGDGDVGLWYVFRCRAVLAQPTEFGVRAEQETVRLGAFAVDVFLVRVGTGFALRAAAQTEQGYQDLVGQGCFDDALRAQFREELPPQFGSFVEHGCISRLKISIDIGKRKGLENASC